MVLQSSSSSLLLNASSSLQRLLPAGDDELDQTQNRGEEGGTLSLRVQSEGRRWWECDGERSRRDSSGSCTSRGGSCFEAKRSADERKW